MKKLKIVPNRFRKREQQQENNLKHVQKTQTVAENLSKIRLENNKNQQRSKTRKNFSRGLKIAKNSKKNCPK